MKLFQFLMLTLLSVSVCAQEQIKERRDSLHRQKTKRWSMGISRGYIIAEPQIIYESIEWGSDRFFNRKNVLKNNTDFHLGYNCWRKYFIIMGGSQDDILFTYHYHMFWIDPSIFGTAEHGFTFRNIYFITQKHFVFKRFSLKMGAGPQRGVLYLNTGRYIGSPSKPGYTYVYSSFSNGMTTIEGRFQLNICYRLLKALDIQFESVAIRSIKGIVVKGKYYSVEYDPKYFKFNLGIVYHFNL